MLIFLIVSYHTSSFPDFVVYNHALLWNGEFWFNTRLPSLAPIPRCLVLLFCLYLPMVCRLQRWPPTVPSLLATFMPWIWAELPTSLTKRKQQYTAGVLSAGLQNACNVSLLHEFVWDPQKSWKRSSYPAGEIPQMDGMEREGPRRVPQLSQMPLDDSSLHLTAIAWKTPSKTSRIVKLSLVSQHRFRRGRQNKGVHALIISTVSKMGLGATFLTLGGRVNLCIFIDSTLSLGNFKWL